MKDLDKLRTPEGEVIRSVQTSSPSSSTERVLTSGLAKYFRAALDRLNYLEYGDPAEYFARTQSIEVPKSPLESVWVPPRFKQQDESGDDVVLDTLLADANPCLLVLADPGCGKSTLSRFLTCFFINRFSQGHQDYFGLFVPLSIIRTSGFTYQEAVVHCASKFVGLDEDREVITALMANLQHACLVFDGLDELPVSRRETPEKDPIPLRREVAELIRTLRYVQPSHVKAGNPLRSIVTSRSRDYSEDRESTLGSVPRYFISTFSSQQMNAAVRQWHEAAKTLARDHLKKHREIVEAIDERRVAIQSALREHFELATVCLTPLMLNVLQTVYSDAKDVPSSVSQLCWRAIAWFLVEKHRTTSQKLFVEENGEWLTEIITRLGWDVHERVVAGLPKSFDNADLRRVARLVCTVKSLTLADYQTLEDAITRVVSFLRGGHGIIVKVANDKFDFVHNIFREVMAGRALGRLPVPERRERALNDKWIGPIRYWAGLRATERDGLYEISAFVGELSSDVAAGSTQAVLARGEMLVEVCSVVSPDRFTHDLKRQIGEVKGELSALLRSDALRITMRIRIGDLLAVLGDPKLEAPILERVSWIEAGDRVIGRKENHRTRISKYQTCPASPTVSGHLKRFGIAALLVTNREFKDFIDAGGYQTKEYWPSELSWKWVCGETQTVEFLIEKTRAGASTHLSSELAGQRLVPDEIPERCVQMIRRAHPMYWADPACNRLNQPVVGVNWWEAIAYCRWLDQNLKRTRQLSSLEHVRLPIETEWESAARLCGDGESYPWLKGEPSDCAHVRAAFSKSGDPPVFRSCAVGLFQCVQTRLPLFDLVGNVWEWTATKVGAYTARSFEQVVDVEGLDDRISRGSSWLSSEEESTFVTFRSFDPPYNVYEDLGFRIAIGCGPANGR